ncbi:sigma-70 family RNA polymerase sigma factor [Rhizobium calliandrae]|uniref:Sigma-70 family RNA polymerase sigma factor n=1 Tax=Rhizobium calliandrae TaxID=1312182 RepID=A0ABT7KN57_9HYPH|nr:sigma-70 family RNA polymerase sigma factor [Rhizobium calliandrae]MDL2410069.1 sigma-70 family RNA polymerase sigma factor [Rhizobium calliandrae]
MNKKQTAGIDQESFLAMVSELRPELHRYCARLTGSVIDGEDVVQEAIVKAYQTLQTLKAEEALRAWMFRIAHNRALDLLRSRALRAAEPLEAASEMPDEEASDPLETLMRQEAITTAVSRFVELPTMQRSIVVLKDVLDQSLDDIAGLLEISVDAVKGHLARGRTRLREINARAPKRSAKRVHLAENQRFVELFNRRDWESLRALLADDVKLHQATHAVRSGADVGMFFTIYARKEAIHLAVAWLEGQEVIAVFENGPAPRPHHFMRIEWRDGEIAFIRDYRYVPYVLESAELVLNG